VERANNALKGFRACSLRERDAHGKRETARRYALPDPNVVVRRRPHTVKNPVSVSKPLSHPAGAQAASAVEVRRPTRQHLCCMFQSNRAARARLPRTLLITRSGLDLSLASPLWCSGVDPIRDLGPP
jgi:hypothetical protein